MNPGPGPVGRMNGYALIATTLGAVAVSVLAVLLLSPGQGPPVPDGPAAASVVAERFTPAELSRADDYRSWGRLIGLGSLIVQLLVLALLVFRRGPVMLRLLAWLGRRPLVGAMLCGAGISILLSVADLPFDLAAWQLGRDFGLISQGLGSRLLDWAMAAAIALVPATLGALIAMFLWLRLGKRFWIAAAGLVAIWAVVTTWLWPVVVSPVFNNFDSLREGSERTEVMRLADRAGVEVGEVYVVDASRRSSTVNAYVNGIGSSKRVVIYDNAIRKLDQSEFRALVGHELGHVKDQDLWRGLAFAMLVIPLGALFVQLGTVACLRRRNDSPEGPAVIPALALMATIAALVLQIPGNVLSRSVEARADRTSIQLTGDPQGLVDLQVRLARSNLSDVDPPAVWQFLFGTHPSTLDRIAIAEGAR